MTPNEIKREIFAELAEMVEDARMTPTDDGYLASELADILTGLLRKAGEEEEITCQDCGKRLGYNEEC